MLLSEYTVRPERNWKMVKSYITDVLSNQCGVTPEIEVDDSVTKQGYLRVLIRKEDHYILFELSFNNEGISERWMMSTGEYTLIRDSGVEMSKTLVELNANYMRMASVKTEVFRYLSGEAYKLPTLEDY